MGTQAAIYELRNNNYPFFPHPPKKQYFISMVFPYPLSPGWKEQILTNIL